MIESLVAVLLVLTITFCVVLNGRLKKLKADEQALKGTIAELITATEIAERAIAGLKMTVRDCDQNLSDRLRVGEALARELGVKLEGGHEVLRHLAQIALAARPGHGPAPSAAVQPLAPKAQTHDAQATAQAASAFAARARQRLSQAA
ncbi:MAG: chemotaxis protein [Alphaproteobacteria bacterium]|nr:chemotaxis protein [Alphaproteobacteria bacterium]